MAIGGEGGEQGSKPALKQDPQQQQQARDAILKVAREEGLLEDSGGQGATKPSGKPDAPKAKPEPPPQPIAITVRAPQVVMEVGAKALPDLKPVLEGQLLPGDELTLSGQTDVGADAAINLAGYQVRPVLTWVKGDAGRYAVTLVNGWLKVRPTWDSMEKEIKSLRDRWLKLRARLPKEQDQELQKIFDKVRDHRLSDKDELAEEAEALRSLASEIGEAEYVKVTAIEIAAHAGRIEVREALKLAAQVQPAQATQPGIRWSVDRDDLATIAPDGTLARTGREGGAVRVTATSACRDGLMAHAVVNLRPLPQLIEVAEGQGVYFGRPMVLAFKVLPPEADQRVSWKRRQPAWKKNCSMDGATGTISVVEPDRSGGSRSGWLNVQAVSAVDPEVTGDGAVRISGSRPLSIKLTASASKVDAIGQSVHVSAKVEPAEAEQEVIWSLDDDSVAALDNASENAVDVRMTAGGTVTLRAVSAVAGDVDASVTVGVKVHLTGFDVTVPKTAIGIVEALKFTPVFTPKEAASKLNWQLAKGSPAGSIDKGVLKPAAVGEFTVVASVPDTAFTKTIKVTVSAGDAMAVTDAQWPQIRELMKAFSKKLCIHEIEACNAKFERWLYDLGQKFEKQAYTRTLLELRDDMVAWRDDNWRLGHWEWLEKAEFAAGGNCYIRNDETLAHDSKNYRVHMTMFPTDATVEIGPKADYEKLENKIYRTNRDNFVSMHATLYVKPVGKDDQVKVYTSGDDWKPPGHVKAFLGGNVKYQQLRTALAGWMNTNMGHAQTALKTVFDRVHKDDDKKIA